MRIISSYLLLSAFMVTHHLGGISALGFNTLQQLHPVDRIELRLSQLPNFPRLTVCRFDPSGFAVVIEDSSLFQVVAYSEHSHWPDHIDPEEPFIKWLHAALERHQDHGWNQANFSFSRQWPKAGTTATGGWLETCWHQDEPYNWFCPTDPILHQRSKLGCAAVALGQIVHFHRHVGQLRFNEQDRYVTSSYGIAIDADSTRLGFPSFEALNAALQEIRNSYQVPQQELNPSQVAALCFAAAVLTKTDFKADYSSVSNIDPNIFARLDYVSGRFMQADSNLFYQLQEDIMNRRPALLIIPGHAAVVDGYHTDRFFHLNFGWGKNKPQAIAEAWFKLNGNGHSEQNIFPIEAIVNIQSIGYPTLAVNKTYLQLKCNPGDSLSASQCLQLENPNEQAIVVDYLIVPPGFYLSDDGITYSDSLPSFSLEPGATKLIFIRFKPQLMPLIGDLLVSYHQEQNWRVIRLRGEIAPLSGTLVFSGRISGRWAKTQSPFHILGDVFLRDGDQLIIEPGVDVLFWGHYELEIKGEAQFIARGSPEDTIRFRPVFPDIGWGGIHIFNSGADDVLSFCSISGGKSTSWGGGIWIADSAPLIRNCRITTNNASYGGGIYLWKSSPTIRNCIIAGNTAQQGAALYAEWFSQPYVVNCTIADNLARTGAGIYASYHNHILLKNSILWDNHAEQGQSIALGMADTLILSYCDVDTLSEAWLCRSNSSGPILRDVGSITADPDFDAISPLLFVPGANSPCIDAGDPDPIFYDRENPNRHGLALWPAKGGLRNDMGCYGGGGDFESTDILQEKRAKPEPMQEIFIQNFPNPFNEETSFYYQLPVAGQVKLHIYNGIGQLVSTLCDEFQTAGDHKIVWATHGLSSGPYWLQIVAGDLVQIKKCILIK